MSSIIHHPRSRDGLGDILERVLDKGVVIAGDVSVSLVGIELLTIRVRLIVASVDKAKEMGINWWEADPTLNASAAALEQTVASHPPTYNQLKGENNDLRGRLALLEERISSLQG